MNRPAMPSRGDREGARIWIEAALETIARDGDEALRVEPLAREIAMSKGSFYWFFTGIDDLRFRALDHWKVHHNDSLFDRVRTFRGTLEERLTYLVNAIVDSHLGRYDAAIRAWALRDPRIEDFVRGIDANRLAFLEELFAGAGADAKESAFRAHVFYRVLIAESYVRQRPGDVGGRAWLADVVERLSADAHAGAHASQNSLPTA